MSYSRTSQRVLQAMADGHLTPTAIAAATGCSTAVIRHIAVKLRRLGLAGSEARGVYGITPAGREWIASGCVIQRTGPTERRTRTARGLRARAWWLMRQLGRWTLSDLLTTLADGSLKAPRTSLLRYIAALEEAGIVRRSKRKVPGTAPSSKGHVLWMLARDVGPKAPVLRPDRGELYDPNHDTTTPLAAQPAQPAARVVHPTHHHAEAIHV